MFSFECEYICMHLAFPLYKDAMRFLSPGVTVPESWFHLFGSIVTFIYYTHWHVYSGTHFPFIARPRRPTTANYVLSASASSSEFSLFFRFSPFFAGFFIMGTHWIGALCLLVADSVSHCKWNGIKWNVKFIVFRGFPCDKRCGNGCGCGCGWGWGWRLGFRHFGPSNGAKQSTAMRNNRLFAYYFKCNLYAYLWPPLCTGCSLYWHSTLVLFVFTRSSYPSVYPRSPFVHPAGCTYHLILN